VKCALDTGVHVDAFRDPAADALLGSLGRALPVTFLSGVVMQEVAAGARPPAQLGTLESLPRDCD
jgi:hypothetical protein